MHVATEPGIHGAVQLRMAQLTAISPPEQHRGCGIGGGSGLTNQALEVTNPFLSEILGGKRDLNPLLHSFVCDHHRPPDAKGRYLREAGLL